MEKANFSTRACKRTGIPYRRTGPTMKYFEIGGYLSTCYRVCTKAIFISKRSYGNVEPRNVILVSVQKAHFPIPAWKLPGFTHCSIWTTMKLAKIRGYLSTWHRFYTKAIFTSKGSYVNVEPKNAILVSMQTAYFPLGACKLPGFTHRCVWPTMKFAEIGSYLSTW